MENNSASLQQIQDRKLIEILLSENEFLRRQLQILKPYVPTTNGKAARIFSPLIFNSQNQRYQNKDSCRLCRKLLNSSLSFNVNKNRPAMLGCDRQRFSINQNFSFGFQNKRNTLNLNQRTNLGKLNMQFNNRPDNIHKQPQFHKNSPNLAYQDNKFDIIPISNKQNIKRNNITNNKTPIPSFLRHKKSKTDSIDMQNSKVQKEIKSDEEEINQWDQKIQENIQNKRNKSKQSIIEPLNDVKMHQKDISYGSDTIYQSSQCEIHTFKNVIYNSQNSLQGNNNRISTESSNKQSIIGNLHDDIQHLNLF